MSVGALRPRTLAAVVGDYSGLSRPLHPFCLPWIGQASLG